MEKAQEGSAKGREGEIDAHQRPRRNTERTIVATRFDNLLDEFRKLPPHPDRRPTFMEIAGCEHKENACSDILAFFLDPARPHGLGTLFLDALARTGGIQNQEAIAGNVKVDREELTEDGNRIDLLIQSNSDAILIENKIFAGVGNPLGDYAKYLDCLKPTGRHKHKFLLTLTPNSEGAEYGFQNITHKQLVKEIRGTLGRHVATADTRYLTFMLDFLNTLDYLRGGMVVNPEFVGLLASRSGEAERFLKEIEHFKGELRKKVTYLENLIDVSEHSNVKQFLWPGRMTKALYLEDTLAHHIELSPFENKVVVDTVISPKGWEVQFAVRGDDDRAREELRKLLRRLDIRFDEGEESKRLIMKERFKYTEDLGQIHPVAREIVVKLAGSDRTW